MMGPLAVAQRYFDAWNRHAPDEILATFAEGGTYADPATDGDLTGPAIAGYAAGLISAFPDLSFKVVNAMPAGDGEGVAAEWRMRGTHRGPLQRLPPTGARVDLKGADFLAIEGEKIRSVRGYFDQQEFLRQLGLQVAVQPPPMGPVSFGTAVYTQPGNLARPGALSLTAITARSEEEVQQIGALSQKITEETLAMPGFISSLLAVVGRRMFTVTAWEDAEAPRRLLQQGTHRDAMRLFFGPDLSEGGPVRQNAMWVRCTACGRMVDVDRHAGACTCGAQLPEPPAYL